MDGTRPMNKENTTANEFRENIEAELNMLSIDGSLLDDTFEDVLKLSEAYANKRVTEALEEIQIDLKTREKNFKDTSLHFEEGSRTRISFIVKSISMGMIVDEINQIKTKYND